MSKLPSLFPELILTQGLHGKEQKFQAFDFSNKYRNLFSPIDGVKLRSRSSIGTQVETFNLMLPDTDKTIIQCVHCKPTQKVGYVFKKGEKIGELVPYINSKGQRADHWHIAIKHKNNWYPLPSITQQNVDIITRDGVDKKWENWSSYKSIQLSLPNMQQLTQEQKDILIKAISNGDGINMELHIERVNTGDIDEVLKSYVDFIGRIAKDTLKIIDAV